VGVFIVLEPRQPNWLDQAIDDTSMGILI